MIKITFPDLSVKEFENAVTKITEAVILPKPMDK